MKNVLLGVTGSIAAYKAADIVRLMKGRGWDVTVIMTKAATEFIGEVTLRTLSRNPVAVEMFPKTDEWVPGHISLAEKADVLVIAPCTANVIAKLAHGIADDLLSCTALACTVPLVVAPAMNGKMFAHPATAENLAILKKRAGIIVDTEYGELACGCEGRGRMAAPETIVEIVARALGEDSGKDRQKRRTK